MHVSTIKFATGIKISMFYLKSQRQWERGLGMAYLKNWEETWFGVTICCLGEEGWYW